MARTNLQDWMAKEAERVNQALKEEVNALPAPTRAPARHILESGGKRLRPLLTILFARLFGCGDAGIYRLAASMELLHAATLLHDDILDNAASRRGRDAAHTIYGNTVTILTGDALLAHGNAIVASFANPDLTLCFSRATVQTAAGEILEMNSLGRPELSHAEYLEIARGKTACLIAQACMMGILAAKGSPEQAKLGESFGENLGIAFQIVDDALDFAPAVQTGKPTGGDLHEGKMTPPLRLYRESLSAADRAEFDAAFSSGKIASAQEKAIIAAVGKFVPQAISLADEYLAGALQALAELPDGEGKSILGQIADYVRNRSK